MTPAYTDTLDGIAAAVHRAPTYCIISIYFTGRGNRDNHILVRKDIVLVIGGQLGHKIVL